MCCASTAVSPATTACSSSRPTLRGVPVQRGAVDATAAGAAALAAVGAGIWDSPAAIDEHVPLGERFEPRRDDAWRETEHAAWREFVERAAALVGHSLRRARE